MLGIVYIPFARDLLEEVYAQLDQEATCTYGHAAFLLGIFATTATIMTTQTAQVDVFGTTEAAEQSALAWTKAALDLLEYSNQSGQGSVEEVQASILLGFLLYNLEGFSARAKSLNCAAISIARTLALHTIDSMKEKSRRSHSQQEVVQIEVKRRVWWHLVATDWYVEVACYHYIKLLTSQKGPSLSCLDLKEAPTASIQIT
jgi:Fungal specific transcription factor domain